MIQTPARRLPALADASGTLLKVMLFLTCVVWIFAGLFFHDPWKPDEAYTFGLVHHMLDSGNWIVPMLGGEPFVEKPPIFFIVAQGFAKAFAPVMPLHDGARLATAFFMLLTSLFTALTAHKLNDGRHGLLAVLILLGCVGLLPRAHQLITDMALLSGFAMGFYGFALCRERPWLGGFFLGTGVGLGFMSKGMIAPGALGLIALALPLTGPQWRQRRYFLALAVSLAVMLPWLAVWPWLLYRESPKLFNEWFFVQNWGRFHGTAHLSFPNERGFYFKILPWYGWPAWPLALWALWRYGPGRFAEQPIQLPLVCFTVVMLVLSLAGESRELYALPLLIPLSLLAVAGADGLRLSAVATINRLSLGIMALLALALWLGWLCMVLNWPFHWAEWILNLAHSQSELPFMPVEFALAVIASVICLTTIVSARRDDRRPIINWTAGLTLLWALAMTLWLPVIDEQKSYRRMMNALYAAMPPGFDCIASRKLGEPQRALLDYYLGLVTLRLENGEGKGCRLLLEQGDTASIQADPPSYRKIWEGARPGDSGERYWLYQRED